MHFSLLVMKALMSLALVFADQTCFSSTVPSGFEALVHSRDALVDVRVLGRSVGYFNATIEPQAIRFQAPDTLLLALPLRNDLDEAARSRLLAVLSAPLPRTATQNPSAADDAGAAAAAPALAQIMPLLLVFDEATDTARLAIDKTLVALPERPDDLHETSPDARRAFIQRQSVTATATRAQGNLSFIAAAALGVSADSHFGAVYGVDAGMGRYWQGHEAYLAELYYRRDFARSHYFQAGRMGVTSLYGRLGSGFGFKFLPLDTIDGARFGTTAAWQRRDGAAQRSPLIILLERPARVDVFRGHQILGSFYLDAGAQPIPTNLFPPGSYQVDVRIIEDGQITRSETMPYFGLLAGRGSPGEIAWFLQAGKAQGYGASGPSATGGMQISLPADVAMTLGVAVNDETAYAEVGLDWQRRLSIGNVWASAAFFASNNGVRGDSQQLAWQHDQLGSLAGQDVALSLSVNRQSVRTHACRATERYYCFRTLSATATANIFSWTFTAGYTDNWSSYAFAYLPWLEIESQPHALQARGRPGNYANSHAHGALPGAAGSGHRSGAMPVVPASEWTSNLIYLSANHAFRWQKLTVNATLSAYTRRRSSKNSSGVEKGVFARVDMSRYVPPSASDDTSWSTGAGVSANHVSGVGTRLRYSANQSLSRRAGSLRFASLGIWGQGRADEMGVRGSSYFESPWGRLSLNAGDVYNRGEHRHYPGGSVNYASAFSISSEGAYWGSDNGSIAPSSAFVLSVAPAANAAGAWPDGADTRPYVVEARTQRLRQGERLLLPLAAFSEHLIDVQEPDVGSDNSIAALLPGSGRKRVFLLPGQQVVQAISAAVNYTYIGRLTLAPASARGVADGVADETLEGATVLDAAVPDLGMYGALVADFTARPRTLHLLKAGHTYACPLPQPEDQAPLQRIGLTQCQPIAREALPAHLRQMSRVRQLLERFQVREAI